jgi:hypothetical protein
MKPRVMPHNRPSQAKTYGMDEPGKRLARIIPGLDIHYDLGKDIRYSDAACPT